MSFYIKNLIDVQFVSSIINHIENGILWSHMIFSPNMKLFIDWGQNIFALQQHDQSNIDNYIEFEK